MVTLSLSQWFSKILKQWNRFSKCESQYLNMQSGAVLSETGVESPKTPISVPYPARSLLAAP